MGTMYRLEEKREDRRKRERGGGEVGSTKSQPCHRREQDGPARQAARHAGAIAGSPSASQRRSTAGSESWGNTDRKN